MQKSWYSMIMLVLLMVVPVLFGCDADSTVVTDGDVADGDEESVTPPTVKIRGCSADNECNTGERCQPQAGASCESDADCPEDTFGANATCAANGYCAYTECRSFCDDACIPADGFFCDEETNTCKTVKCAACEPDSALYHCGKDDDGEQIACSALSTNGNSGTFCLGACTLPTDCPMGYSCSLGLCKPRAKCPAKDPASLPGEGCEFGPLFPGRTCAAGDSCVGNDSSDQSCASQDDCNAWAAKYSNITPEVTYCANGICGFAMCVVPCELNGTCPVIEGYDTALYPDTISGSCYCGPDPLFAPIGTASVGNICNIPGGPESHLPLCLPDLECLGGTDFDSSCESDNDCSTDDYGPNAFCAKTQKCSYNFCTSFCENGLCEEGTNYVAQLNQCRCTVLDYAMGIGTAGMGEMCNPGNAEALPDCEAGLHCRGNNKPLTECTSIDDCTQNAFGPNRYCDDNGYCGYSVCAVPCDDGECAVIGTEPLKNTAQALCLCAPAPYGGDGPLGPEDVDPCDPNPCKAAHKTVCADDGGNAVCSCDNNYHLGEDDTTCTDDPCDPNPCTTVANKTVCTDNSGNAACSCEEGYHPVPGDTCAMDVADGDTDTDVEGDVESDVESDIE